MRYRRNHSKCVILDNQPQIIEYAIYDQVLPHVYDEYPIFYWGKPIRILQAPMLSILCSNSSATNGIWHSYQLLQSHSAENFRGGTRQISKARTSDYYPAVDKQSLSTLSCGYQCLMNKEINVYDGALVGCQMGLSNPALDIPTTTCQDVTSSAA
ncbi:hypothetical protein RO3G_12693 [Rhizopus delemar RA 99-880]|uniref:Uncharacterized protein n=1 Tax=Rhizopus delemar (strain RA 99-880 / ATCC MYA-4621 / FGSC 9543 / NRRL 43880) TaxID=246409 RepID=I1CHQ2_RHIO9|nr:hypothetical protein RO3G_12693 [Rhizopus delemar RA 99-880]|eukprot:EIE87982.1 hypothetical protein RO3G_12693 [Rhizopus delemar RA 99-880]